MAVTHGGGLLYVKAAPFDPDDDADDVTDPPQHLVRHRGQVGQVTVAFRVDGMTHFWEQTAPWYQQWRDLVDAPAGRWVPAQRDDDVDTDQPSEAEQSRLTEEFVTRMLADPTFRAAKSPARHRQAQLAAESDPAHRWLRWDGTRAAVERADQLAQEQYQQQITPRLNELAAELVSSPDFQEASSAAARKLAAERFLIAAAGGFAPPAVVRDELYARAQRLAKNGSRAATMF
jgi:hypothetical protein